MKRIVLFFAIFSLFISCSDSNSTETEETVKLDSLSVDTLASKEVDEEKEFKLFMIIANVPSPSHEITELGKQNLVFKSELPNDCTNESKYSESFKTAVNYGVYIADFSYVAAFKNNKLLLNYFATCRKMAEKATVLKTFEEVVKSDFIQKNAGNPDALEKVLDTLYVNTEKFLETDHHLDIAAKILLGSWIEAQYIFLAHLKEMDNNDKTKPLFSKLWENKIHLNHINELLTEYKDHSELNMLATSLVAYEKNYEGIASEKDFSKGKVEKMFTELSAIRTEIIK